MNIQNFSRLLIVLVSSLSLWGCGSMVKTETPLISHVHIGHAMTGWTTTPDKQGLFIVAETEAQIVIDIAKKAARESNDLNEIKQNTSDLLKIMETPKSASKSAHHHNHHSHANKDTNKQNPEVFGFINALSEARDHIEYAADSEDASESVKRYSQIFSRRVDVVLERSQLITALGNDILVLDDFDEAKILAEEVYKLTKDNVNGVDLDNNGYIGNSNAEFGMIQLRRTVQSMIDNEVPAYKPVESKYLFSLIRLPNGVWKFLDSFDENSGALYYD
jgi:hypothetical protein